jgi:V/A-type H+-transporting ATPase subunit G/H
MQEIIHQIKDWETKARDIISAAEKDAQQVIASAKTEADQLKSKAQKEIEDYRKEILDETEKDALIEATKIKDEGKRRLEEIKLLIKKNMPETADFIAERVQKVDGGS